MALSKNLEALLALMGQSEAAAQREVWEKNPAIAAAMEKAAVPQDVFNRELNAKEERAKAAENSYQKIKDWEKENRPKFDSAIADLTKLEKEKTEWGVRESDLQARIDKLSETGGEVDGDKLYERVEKRIGGKPVSEARLSQIVKEETTKMRTEIKDDIKQMLDQTREDFLTKTFPAVTSFQADLAEVMGDYKDEFGKKLDRGEFSKFMQEQQITSPRLAYERYTAKDREERRIKAEVDKQVQAELAKRMMPGVSSGGEFTGTGELSPLQLKISGEGTKFPDGSEVGDGVAANMAAKELRQQGAF